MAGGHTIKAPGDRFTVCGDGCPNGTVAVAITPSSPQCPIGGNNGTVGVTCLVFEGVESFTACGGGYPGGYRPSGPPFHSFNCGRGGSINAQTCVKL